MRNFYRLQDADGGFFEKFGSLLRQQSQLEENDLKTSLAPLKDEAVTEETNFESNESPDSSDSSQELDCSVIDTLSLDTDVDLSETKEKKEKIFEKSVGVNVSILVYIQYIENKIIYKSLII